MNGLRLLLLLSATLLGACGYVRSEHYDLSDTRDQVTIGQMLNSDNQVIDAHGALRLHAQALFLQLRDLHADIGTHQMHCRLQDAHGDIIDEQTQSIVQAPGQTLLLGICYFPLRRDLVTGLWHYDIDLDDAPVADNHLIMRP